MYLYVWSINLTEITYCDGGILHASHRAAIFIFILHMKNQSIFYWTHNFDSIYKPFLDQVNISCSIYFLKWLYGVSHNLDLFSLYNLGTLQFSRSVGQEVAKCVRSFWEPQCRHYGISTRVPSVPIPIRNFATFTDRLSSGNRSYWLITLAPQPFFSLTCVTGWTLRAGFLQRLWNEVKEIMTLGKTLEYFTQSFLEN